MVSGSDKIYSIPTNQESLVRHIAETKNIDAAQSDLGRWSHFMAITSDYTESFRDRTTKMIGALWGGNADEENERVARELLELPTSSETHERIVQIKHDTQETAAWIAAVPQMLLALVVVLLLMISLYRAHRHLRARRAVATAASAPLNQAVTNPGAS